MVKLEMYSLREDLEMEFILVLHFFIRSSKTGLFAILGILGQFVHLRCYKRLLPQIIMRVLVFLTKMFLF